MFDKVKSVIKKGKGIFNIVRRGRSLSQQGSTRLRSSCPNCGSTGVVRRIRWQDYTCRSCGWKGKNVNKVEWPPKCKRLENNDRKNKKL